MSNRLEISTSPNARSIGGSCEANLSDECTGRDAQYECRYCHKACCVLCCDEIEGRDVCLECQVLNPVAQESMGRAVKKFLEAAGKPLPNYPS